MEIEKTDEKRVREIQTMIGEMVELNNLTPDECIKAFSAGLCSTFHAGDVTYEAFCQYLDQLKVLYKQRDSEPESE